MNEKYADEINACESIIHEDNRDGYVNRVESQVVFKGTTTDALFSDYCKDWKDKKVCVLNFASYKNPGGGFLTGAQAQEESLCHTSFLYNVLEKMKPYYEWNLKHNNFGLYFNRAIYSKNIRFFNENKSMVCDVLTCAAPNRSVIEKYGSFTEEQNYDMLKSRINFIKSILGMYDIDTVILGAWGCGVFKQNPDTIARLFSTGGLPVKNVVYAVPDGWNYKVFSEII